MALWRRARSSGLQIGLIGLIGFIGFIGFIELAAADAPVRLPPAGGEGWQPFTFRRIEKHTHYERVERDGDRWLRADSRCAASARVTSLDGIDLARTPILHWRWRVDTPLEIPDERARQGDDFAARVYVMFRFEPERATLFERLRHRLGSSTLGREPPGSALSFVWTSREPPGTVWTNPYSDDTRMLALVRNELRRWRIESVDVPARYRAAFGREPPPLLALGLMTDADDSCQRATAGYADFRFTPREAR